MSVDPSLAGRSFPPTEPYDVTADAVAEFAAATGTPYAEGDPAPTTFPIVVAFEAMLGLMADPTVGIELHHVVHGEQRFEVTRPVVVGDRLRAELAVERLRQVSGTDIISTASTVTDAEGRRVCVARATLVHRSDS